MKAVIWVSTVLYILISLAVIGIVIAAVQPRIAAARDKAVIEQTIIMLNSLDQTINEVNYAGQGNKRSCEFKLSKGTLTINASDDKIIWRLEDSAYRFSEPGIKINISKIQALTTKSTEGFDIALTLDYKDKINLTYAQKETSHTFQPGELPYKLFIENKACAGCTINQLDITVS